MTSLSVVVVPYAGPAYLARCLRALAPQCAGADCELIVPHDDAFGDVSALRAELRGVHWVPVSGSASPAALRAAGARAATGDVVAFTEDHCTPDAGWCAALRSAHAASHAAVGGAVDEDAPRAALDWAVYLCDYGRYMRPLAAGPAASLTDCNVSYKREALDGARAAWAQEFHETAVNEALRARGASLWLAPEVVVREARHVTLGPVLRERYVHGRLYAGLRAAGAPLGARAPLAVKSLLLPAVLTARAAGTLLRKRGRALTALRVLPALAAVTAAWAAGELVGYITGRAASAASVAAARASAAPEGAR